MRHDCQPLGVLAFLSSPSSTFLVSLTRSRSLACIRTDVVVMSVLLALATVGLLIQHVGYAFAARLAMQQALRTQLGSRATRYLPPAESFSFLNLIRLLFPMFFLSSHSRVTITSNIVFHTHPAFVPPSSESGVLIPVSVSDTDFVEQKEVSSSSAAPSSSSSSSSSSSAVSSDGNHSTPLVNTPKTSKKQKKLRPQRPLAMKLDVYQPKISGTTNTPAPDAGRPILLWLHGGVSSTQWTM